ncbi:PP2C family protein-serine/threonine phosphatase [Paracoccus suum]|uniref:PP2C family protein-serine/threonine phosphatase n=1 Tax=Paracoccus suum TaxID=2259340 RepID=UPI0013B04FE1|nr:SpoIIE family protein phosphatase [Paracoccus suum]
MAKPNRQIAPVSGVLRPSGGRRVLLAAEPGDARQGLALQLAAIGLQVTVAGTAAEALRAAAERPDFILCDWQVGDLTAADLCRACRAGWAEDQFAYFIVIIPPTAGKRVEAALGAGADDFLMSPVVPIELAARLAAGERFLTMAGRLSEGRREMAETLARLQAIQAETEADLSAARRLQQGLLGARNARFGEVEVSLLLRPAGHVGGDLVGFFPINARRVALYAIDVSGNGVAAALLTARLAAYLSGIAGENIALRLDENDLYDARRPAEVAQIFNRLMLEEMATEAYFTMVYVDLDVMSGKGQLVQAGHPHPLLQHADGSVEVLGLGGMPIGLISGASWEEVTFQLEPGGRLFVCSDGITEAENHVGAMLAENGLIAILRTNAFLGGSPFLESLCWSVAQFTQGKRTDDISAVLIERDRILPALS